MTDSVAFRPENLKDFGTRLLNAVRNYVDPA